MLGHTKKSKKKSKDQFCVWAIFLVLLGEHPLRSLAHNPHPARAPTSPHPSHHSPAHQPTTISISSPIPNPKSLILSSLFGPCGSTAGAGRRGAVGGAAGSSRRRGTHQRTATASTAAAILLMTFITSTLHSSIPHPAYASVQPITKTGGLLTTELLSSGWAGFFAGCLHTLSGPDHLVALAPLSIGRSRLESGLVGALWGCGHDAGQVIFGLLFLLLKDRLHIEVLRTWGTRVVGLTLLIIGGMGIREASEVHESSLALAGVDCNMSSSSEPLQTPAAPRKKKVGFATFATGVVHGLQPDALLMVLPALALPSRLAGAAFLGMFLVGTVFSMGSYTAFVGSCSEALKERVPRITEKLTWAASLIAICMGIALLVGQFFGFSLY